MDRCQRQTKHDVAASSNTKLESVDYNECCASNVSEAEILTKNLIRDALENYDLMFGEIFSSPDGDPSKLPMMTSSDVQKVNECKTMSLATHRQAVHFLSATNSMPNQAANSKIVYSIKRSSFEGECDNLDAVLVLDDVHLDCQQHQKSRSFSLDIQCSPVLDTCGTCGVLRSIKSESSIGAADSVQQASCDPVKGSVDIADVSEKARALHSMASLGEENDVITVSPITSASEFSNSSLVYGASSQSEQNVSCETWQELVADDNNNEMSDVVTPAFRQRELAQFPPFRALDVLQKIQRSSHRSNFKVNVDLVQH
jgi:hypothetical protein